MGRFAARGLTRGQEFIAHDRLYHVVGPEAYAYSVKVDVAKIPEADRPYDPGNWRPPESRDVVYAYDHDGMPLGHRLLANLDPGQRCVFQGLKYHIEPGPTPNTGTLIGDGEVDHPSAARLFVWLQYTIHDALGTATVGYRYPKGRLIPLCNGSVAAVEDLTPGAVFRLEQEGEATVASVGVPKPWKPSADCNDAQGNTVRNVVGTFQFTGWVRMMTVTVGGLVHHVTPEHPYWSETRRGWHPINTFEVGELLRSTEGKPLPIEARTSPAWVHETVYNYEVETDHTYFVGTGDTAVWVHNGLGGAGCGVPKAAEVAEYPIPKGGTSIHELLSQLPAINAERAQIGLKPLKVRAEALANPSEWYYDLVASTARRRPAPPVDISNAGLTREIPCFPGEVLELPRMGSIQSKTSRTGRKLMQLTSEPRQV